MLKAELEKKVKELEFENTRLKREYKKIFDELQGYKKDNNELGSKSLDLGNYVLPEEYKTLAPMQKQAFLRLISGENLFITGDAGTGKSYLSDVFSKFCELNDINIIKTAPTGIASQHIDGATLHKTFNVKPQAQLTDATSRASVLRYTDILMIDEISMTRIDVFDYVMSQVEMENAEREKFNLKHSYTAEDKDYKKPVQIMLVGDFYQLPPVLREDEKQILETHRYHKSIGKGFCFLSDKWDKLGIQTITLKDNFRQRGDDAFKEGLDLIKYGNPQGLGIIKHGASKVANEDAINLVGKNATANDLNLSNLAKITGKEYISNAVCEGEFKPSDFNMEKELHLKVGAKIVFLTNDRDGDYHNGTIGTVVSMNDYPYTIQIQTEHGVTVSLERYVAELKKYEVCEKKVQVWDEENQKFNSVSVSEPTLRTTAKMEQFPIKLGYAITIHKSQGQTYENANLYPEIFEDGQLYVGLSRLKSLDGLYINGYLQDRMVRTSQEVKDFFAKNQNSDIEINPINEKFEEDIEQRFEEDLVDERWNF